MIVTCQQCETSFQLDESRIPESGIRVRCSKCKEAFFLPHPSAKPSEAVHDIAGEAAERESTPPPALTQDLTSESPDASGGASGEFEEEEDWEFTEDVSSGDDGDDDSSGAFDDDFSVEQSASSDFGESADLDLDEGRTPAVAEAASTEEESAFGSIDDYSELMEEDPETAPPIEDSASATGFDGTPAVASGAAGAELGEPEEWDFFSDDGAEAPASSAQVKPAPAAASAGVWDDFGETVEDSSGSPSRRRADRPGLRQRLQGVGNALGWVATALLLAAGVSRGLYATYEASFVAPTSVRVGSLVAQQVEGRWLETARAGVVFSVTGRLRNAGVRPVASDEPMQVVLLDADGARIDYAGAPIGVVTDTNRLREVSRQELLADRQTASRRLGSLRLAPGEELSFMAIFDVLPDEARRFDVVVVPRDERVVSEPVTIAMPAMAVTDEPAAFEPTEGLEMDGAPAAERDGLPATEVPGAEAEGGAGEAAVPTAADAVPASAESTEGQG